MRKVVISKKKKKTIVSRYASGNAKAKNGDDVLEKDKSKTSWLVERSDLWREKAEYRRERK